MLRMCALVAVLLSASWVAASPVPVTVDCGAGQSLNSTLAKLDKSAPPPVTVKGTCTEFVVVDGFNNLTLTGASGAALQQPSTNPLNSSYVLWIHASRSVTVSGLAVHSLSTIFSGIGIGAGSTNVHLQSLSIDGSWGVVVYEASQAWLKQVTVDITSGYAAVSAFDKSDVHIVNGTLERAADSNWYVGIFVGSGHVTMQGTMIRDMQQGMNIGSSGSVDTVYFDGTVPSADVVITSPGGANYAGVAVSDGSSLNIGSCRLRITGAGQTSGWNTAAVLVDNGSTLNGGANLVISASRGQGVLVSNNSHATLAGSSITSGGHGGLVVVNLSTATVWSSTPLTAISGNATDLFCDSRSQIAGSGNITGATTIQCTNLLIGDFDSLP